MSTYRVDLCWRGDAYAGWQRQPAQRTIQGELESALSQLFATAIQVRSAGRTDAGVHALHQVVAFSAPVQRSVEQITRGLNAQLPRDILCLKVIEAADDFNPRSAAVAKLYVYRVLSREKRCPFRENQIWHFRYPVDLSLLENALSRFQGTHDFDRFRSAGCTSSSSIRTIMRTELIRRDDELWAVFLGKGFLRHQVRNMVGCAIDVSRGRIPFGSLEEGLAGRGGKSWQTAPAAGLWLVRTILDPRSLNGEDQLNDLLGGLDRLCRFG